MKKVLMAAVFFCGMLSDSKAALIAAYDFNDIIGNTVLPNVGTVTGTLSGSASIVAAGVNGGAVSISSAGDGLVNFGPNLFPTGPFSVQVWVDTTSTSEIPLAFHHATVVAGYILGIGNIGDGCGSPAGAAEFYVAYPCSGSSTKLVNDGTWHQLVGVYNGNTSSIYVDGILQSQSSGGNPLNTPPAGTDFLLGGIMIGNTPTNDYQGLLSNVEIYDNALSASAVAALYNSAVLPSPGPEPSSAGLLGCGLLVLRLRRKGKRA